jgi:hypothetical protein
MQTELTREQVEKADRSAPLADNETWKDSFVRQICRDWLKMDAENKSLNARLDILIDVDAKHVREAQEANAKALREQVKGLREVLVKIDFYLSSDAPNCAHSETQKALAATSSATFSDAAIRCGQSIAKAVQELESRPAELMGCITTCASDGGTSPPTTTEPKAQMMVRRKGCTGQHHHGTCTQPHSLTPFCAAMDCVPVDNKEEPK